MILALSEQSFNSKSEIRSELALHHTLALDVETDYPRSRKMLGFAVAWSPRDAVWFSVTEFADDIMRHPMVIHNALFDAPVVEQTYYNVEKLNVVADTMLMAQACGYPPALRDLSYMDYFNFEHKSVEVLISNDITGKRIPRKSLGDVDEEELAKICCNHAKGCYKIWMALNGKCPSAYHQDFSMLELLEKIHNHGIRVDTNLAIERELVVGGEARRYKEECKSKYHFNPASPKQIGIRLSEDGISTGVWNDGVMVTDEEALVGIQALTPIVDIILKFREKSKLNSTYIKPLTVCNRRYPQYHIVRTGRFAASPNIQNVPKPMRDLYVPDEDCWFWDVDLAQIEPVLMAYFSQDPQLLADLATGDVYQPLADRYHIARYVAKQLFLATSYESGAATLVETARNKGDYLSYSNAEALIYQYMRDYRRLRNWGDSVRQDARRDGYVETLLGRKRTLESMAEGEPYGYDPVMKAVNTKIQGSAADIHKASVYRAGYDMKLVINAMIHDELLVSTQVDIDIREFSPLLGVNVAWDKQIKKNWLEV